jgi:probable addiction module antidote protein
MAIETRLFDPSEYLDTFEGVEAYLQDAFETGDAREVADALGVVARALGMSSIARRAGISRQALYKALDRESRPEFETIMKVAAALGFRLVPERIGETA